MRALCWHGKNDVRVETVPDPRLLSPRDAIIAVTSTAICGSDLHLYNGYIPTMQPGDILGHEFMGEVVDVGPEVKNLKKGDRVVVPFTIACGACFFCKQDLWSLCDNSNPNARAAEKLYGYSGSGLFGYSHLFGGYAGGQAEYVRVPFADVGAHQLPKDTRAFPDERVLFLSDILPTAWQAAEQCNIHRGDVVAIWGAGPVGLLAIPCAYQLGAEQVIAIDQVPERLELAHKARADVINFDQVDVMEALREKTGGRGPDACIDAVGMEASGHTLDALYDKAKQAARLETDRPHVLRQALQACRKGGTVSIPGVYGGLIDKVPFGAAFAKGLTMHMGQTHVHRYIKPLLQLIQEGKMDPTFIISHRLPLAEAPRGYEIFKHKRERCTKVVLKP